MSLMVLDKVSLNVFVKLNVQKDESVDQAMLSVTLNVINLDPPVTINEYIV